MARGLSYGTQGAAGVAPHTPLLGTIMASSLARPGAWAREEEV